jgi:hypothetical protein
VEWLNLEGIGDKKKELKKGIALGHESKGLLTRTMKTCRAVSYNTVRLTYGIGSSLAVLHCTTRRNTKIIVCVNRP